MFDFDLRTPPLLYELDIQRYLSNIDICKLVGKNHFKKEYMKLKLFKTITCFYVS